MAERGDIILEGLLRIVAGLLLVGLLVFEIGAVAINHVQLHAAARSSARVAAAAWVGHGSERAVAAALGAEPPELSGAVVRGFAIEEDAAVVALTRKAPVLVADRLPFLEPLLVGDVSARARFVR